MLPALPGGFDRDLISCRMALLLRRFVDDLGIERHRDLQNRRLSARRLLGSAIGVECTGNLYELPRRRERSMSEMNEVAGLREGLWALFAGFIGEDFDRDEAELTLAEHGVDIDEILTAIVTFDFDKSQLLLAEAHKRLTEGH